MGIHLCLGPKMRDFKNCRQAPIGSRAMTTAPHRHRKFCSCSVGDFGIERLRRGQHVLIDMKYFTTHVYASNFNELKPSCDCALNNCCEAYQTVTVNSSALNHMCLHRCSVNVALSSLKYGTSVASHFVCHVNSIRHAVNMSMLTSIKG